VIKRYANEVVTAFLANVLRTGQDAVGSYALAETQGGLFQQAIGAHLDTIANVINEHAVLPLLRLNGIDDKLAPTLTHGDIESADLERLGTYFTSLASAGLLENTPELKVFLHEVAGLPVPTVEEIEAAAEEDEALAAQLPQQPQPPTADENAPPESAQTATEPSGKGTDSRVVNVLMAHQRIYGQGSTTPIRSGRDWAQRATLAIDYAVSLPKAELASIGGIGPVGHEWLQTQIGKRQQAYADLFPAPVQAVDEIEAAVALFRSLVNPEWGDLIDAEVE
jgi:hypothetical protein